MTTLREENKMLHIEGVNLNTLADEFSTPLYVYSETALTDAYNGYQAAFGHLDFLVCYAVKANSNLSVLRHFANLGTGFDIVSGGELERVLAAGGDAGKTIFSGVAKNEAEIAYALEVGVRCFNVESINELDRINNVAERLGKKAPISLRINPDVDAKTHPYISTGLKANKFGIAFKDALGAYLYAEQLPFLDIVGIDCHIGSQLTDLSPLIEAFERLLVLIDELSAKDIVLKHVDLGGGVGIVYNGEDVPNLNHYAQAITEGLQSRGLSLVLEPGRSLVGNAGVLLTRVEFIKRGEEKDFVIIDGAMNDLMRPALYDAYHEISATIIRDDVEEIMADVVGPVCETGDFLGKNRQLRVLEGDILAVQSAGAYAFSMASNYNTRPRAAEVMVSGTDYRLIRKRETIGYLLELESDCL